LCLFVIAHINGGVFLHSEVPTVFMLGSKFGSGLGSWKTPS